MKLSIKNKLLIGLLSLTVITFSLTLVKNYFDTRHEIEALFDAQLAQSARVLLELSDHELHEQIAYVESMAQNEISEHITTQIQQYQQEIDFQIWVGGEHLAVRSETAPTEPFTKIDNVFENRSFGQQLWRVYSISNAEKTIQVQVGQFYQERDNLSTSISTRLITSLSIMLPLLGILILVIVDRAMRPFKKIARQLSERQPDNFDPINVNTVPPEAEPMIRALNDLFNRLQIAFDNIVQFTANAAHELRTPLSALKVHTQVAMQAQDKSVRNEAFDDAMDQVNQATCLVEQLLTLSRLDPESSIKHGETADLYSIVEEKMAELAPAAIRKHIDLSLHANNRIPTHIVGREGLLRILVRNLIENAVCYTPEQGEIEVSITPVDQLFRLRIADSGPGLPPEEYDQVFKRFYRVRGEKEPGTGLGLSMVHKIIKIHDADITLSESPLHGLQVDVFLKPAYVTDDIVAEKDGID